MSDFAARSALSRMNLREVAIAAHYTGLGQDLQMMAAAQPEVEQEKLTARRNELCEAFGLQPQREQSKPFAFSQGIAVIPIHGSLINRFGSSYGFVTGYNFINRQVAQAMADDDVKAIVYDVNSYGGEAAGCFECAAIIHAASKEKPSMSVVDSNAYSAGYMLASAAGRMVCTPSGGVGSIGVVAMHMSYEKMLDEIGIKVTFITFGAHKVDGNPYEALSDEAKKTIQASVDKSGEMFVSAVATQRNMDAKKVKATEASIYRADEALSLGLIDAVQTPSQALQVLFDELSGSTSETVSKDDAMSTQTAAQPGANTDQASKDAATAQAAQAAAAAAQTAANEARVAERARVKGITGSEEAKGKSTLANHLAMETDMSVESAVAILKASPAEAASASTTNAFTAAMDNTAQPNVGANGGAPGVAKTSAEKAQAILADQTSLTGRKLEAAK